MYYRQHRANHPATDDRNCYESELMSVVVIALVSLVGKFWYILMVIGTLGVLSGLGILAGQLFVRGMAWNVARTRSDYNAPAIASAEIADGDAECAQDYSS